MHALQSRAPTLAVLRLAIVPFPTLLTLVLLEVQLEDGNAARVGANNKVVLLGAREPEGNKRPNNAKDLVV